MAIHAYLHIVMKARTMKPGLLSFPVNEKCQENSRVGETMTFDGQLAFRSYYWSSTYACHPTNSSTKCRNFEHNNDGLWMFRKLRCVPHVFTTSLIIDDISEQ